MLLTYCIVSIYLVAGITTLRLFNTYVGPSFADYNDQTCGKLFLWLLSGFCIIVFWPIVAMMGNVIAIATIISFIWTWKPFKEKLFNRDKHD